MKNWKPAKKVGKRVYDDKAFVESVKEQAAAGKRALSARQLEFLIKMAVQYADQIPGCEEKLKESGLGAGAASVQKADPALVAYCFETMDRISVLSSNPFLKSLREQIDRGRGLSMKQFAILAKSVGENAESLEDGEAVRAKLAEFVPGGFAVKTVDPTLPGVFRLLAQVPAWRPAAKKGKKVYDDQEFVKSLSDQFASRHSLSPRQAAALKRVLNVYKDKIPNFAQQAAEIGLETGNGAAAK